jgi:hypothetical protein
VDGQQPDTVVPIWVNNNMGNCQVKYNFFDNALVLDSRKKFF